MSKVHLNYLIAICASAAIASQLMGQAVAFTILKPLTSILIVLLLVLYRQDNALTINLVVIALIACLGGDVLLLDESLFAYGLLSFLLAHLLFAYVFYSLAKGKMNYTPLIVFGIISSGFYLILLPKLGDLAIPVAVYQMCIGLMCWQGVNLALSRCDQVGRLLCIAALLFVLSDSMIAVNKFLVPFDLSGLFILSTYWLSIILIANVFTLPMRELEPTTTNSGLSKPFWVD